MRLINTTTFEFKEIDYPDDPDSPRYAILSHRWAREQFELKFHELEKPTEELKMLLPVLVRNDKNGAYNGSIGKAKVAWACHLAKERGFDWVWIDTCCIKDDRDEKDRSINSMFSWYRHASVCLAYLFDVDKDSSRHGVKVPDIYPDSEATRSGPGKNVESFDRSNWFKRGWTLQELLAPKNVIFFDRNWEEMGSKDERHAAISRATRIDQRYLCGDCDGASIATKMSWAAGRVTRYREDMAYCLLGIFGVNMRTHPGEEYKAFVRLQQLLVGSQDESLYAWADPDGAIQAHGLLAPRPRCFIGSENFTNSGPKWKDRVPHEWQNGGVMLNVPAKHVNNGNGVHLNNRAEAKGDPQELALNCWDEVAMKAGEKKDTLTIQLRKSNGRWQRVDCHSLGRSKEVKKSYRVWGAVTQHIALHVPQD